MPESHYHPPDPPPEREISGFGGIEFRGSTLNRNPSLWTGFRGGVILGERLALGGAYYTARHRFGGPITDQTGRELGLRSAYGGGFIDITVWRKRRAAISIDTLIGGGATCVSNSTKMRGRHWNCIEAVGMFVIEPGIHATFVTTDWLRLGVGFGWRFVARKKWESGNEFTLSGPYLGLNVDFGGFGRD